MPQPVLTLLAAGLVSSGLFAVDASATLDGGSGLDAGPEGGRQDGGGQDVPDLSEVQGEVDALRSLARGEEVPGLRLQRLFSVDLRDEAAVAARVQSLRERLAPTGDVPDADGSDPADASSSLAALLGEREALRLAFLERPVTHRSRLLDLERERDRIAQELSAARQAQREADLAQQRAEEQHKALLAKAAEAVSAAAAELAAESARIEARRASLGELQGTLAGERRHDAEESSTRFERRRELGEQARADPLLPEAADALYDSVVAELVRQRSELRASLDQLDAPTRVSPLKASIDLAAPAYRELADERAALVRALGEVEAQAVRLREEDAAQRWARTQALADEVDGLNQLRFQILPRLSQEKRESVLGVTRQGLAQLGRELEQLHLMARWYPRQRASAVRSLPTLLEDLFTLGSATWTLFRLALLGGLVVVLRRRGTTWLGRLRSALVSYVRIDTLRLWFDRWLGHLATLTAELVMLAAAYVGFGLLAQLGEPPELEVAQALGISYAWYRLVLAAVHRFLTSAAATRNIKITSATSLRILRSIRLVARFAYGVVAVLLLSEHLLGRGYLYTLVVEFSWLGSLPIAYVLLRHWREELAAVYRRGHPAGRFTALLSRHHASPLGVALLLPAFVVVAGHTVASWLKDLLLGIVHIRRAVAYLFRRRLERQAKVVGHAAAQLEELPAPLREAFAEAPAPPELAVEHFPGRTETEVRLRAFAAGSGAVLTALFGQRGAGKTSWLAGLARGLPEVEVRRFDVARRVVNPSEMCRMLSEAAGVAPAADVDALVLGLRAAPRRVVLLDRCQNLMLAAMDGLRGFEAFAQVAGRTAGHVAFVCAFSRYSWDHLRNVYRGPGPFQEVVELGPWDEARLGECIRRRMARAQVEAVYDDLVVDRMDGADITSEAMRTAERYLQLLWQFSDGNPRMALHFWLRSLVPAGAGRARVRLFQAPSADALEALTEPERYLLAALVRHENLTLEQSAACLSYPTHRCEAHLARLGASGYLEVADDTWRITTHWYLAVIRFLRRKHLLFS